MNTRQSSDSRNEYIINYRNGLSTQIRAKEDSVWRFIAYFAGAWLLLVNFGLDVEGLQGFLTIEEIVKILIISTIIIIASFWGFLITLDSNYWFQRNLIIIRNIEKSLLNKRDYGLIIPKFYGVPIQKYEYTTFTKIQNQIFTFSLTITLVVILFFGQNHTDSVELLALLQLSGCLFSILLHLVMVNNIGYVDRLYGDQISAPGKTFPEDKGIPSKDDFLTNTLKKSSAETNLSIITTFGLTTYATIFFRNIGLIGVQLSEFSLFGKALSWKLIIILFIFFTAFIFACLLKKEKTWAGFISSHVNTGLKIAYFLRALAVIVILVGSVSGFFFLLIHSLIK
jgi:hypothetical protein